MYKWHPQCSAYVAQLVCQSQTALGGESTSVHFVCSELDFQQMVLSKQETTLMWRHAVWWKVWKGALAFVPGPSSPSDMQQDIDTAVCLSIRYDLERHPQRWPICDGFVLGSLWGCSGLSVVVLKGSLSTQSLPSAVVSKYCLPLSLLT